MSRFASDAPVFFIEEPIHLDDISRDTLEVSQPVPGVYRAVPRLRGSFRGDYDASLARIRELSIAKLATLEPLFSNAVQWFYTPMPAPAMLGAFNEVGVVYDCMDELAQFRHAPADILRRERLLISNSDVVFTGGHRLYVAKSKLHSNVHFFGCGVDAQHFAKARDRETRIPPDAQTSSRVAGYFGVIDERLDYDLIKALADRNPDIAVVMVGPTAKVSPEELPKAPNIHWLGQRSYDELPAYVKSFDVCLMPFALNAATEFINPTKTLEYMAAGKPIVSTAVADVVRNFTPIVSVAYDQDEFIDAVKSALARPDRNAIAEGLEKASQSSWESIVDTMQNLIQEAIAEFPIPPAADVDLTARDSASAEI